MLLDYTIDSFSLINKLHTAHVVLHMLISVSFVFNYSKLNININRTLCRFLSLILPNFTLDVTVDKTYIGKYVGCNMYVKIIIIFLNHLCERYESSLYDTWKNYHFEMLKNSVINSFKCIL